MRLVRGFTQALSDTTGIGDADAIQARIDATKKEDAPLLETGYGQAGDIFGTIATALPAAFIPGANTYLGATGTGAALGALQPVASDESRLENTAFGAAGGLAGQAGGRAIL